jgi:23S rRNA pseudouridine1911/1915/1917 synthase
MMEKHLAVVSAGEAGRRLDQFLADRPWGLTRSYLQKLIGTGQVSVDGAPVTKSSYRLMNGQSVEAFVPDATPVPLVPQAIPLLVVYEDDDVMVVNKPADMVVHPAPGHRDHTLVNALLYHLSDLSGIGGRIRPGIVHRLDKNTTGLMVVAKNDASHVSLQEQLREHETRRTYAAIIWGRPPVDEGTVDVPVGRSTRHRKKMAAAVPDGRDAITHYSVERVHDFTSRLTIRLETGRTHQIRVHMRHIGHPVFGDPTYGGRDRMVRAIAQEVRTRAKTLLDLIHRQALHAAGLRFVHPRTGKEMSFTAPPPEDLSILLQELEPESET